MADYYTFNPFKREVSFAVLPIDVYTGKPIDGKRVDVIERNTGQKAAAKSDGGRVFVNMPAGIWRVDIISEEYFSETLTVDSRDMRGIVINASLIPNGHYKLPRGATYLDVKCEAGTEIYALPFGCDGQFKLRGQTEEQITLRPVTDEDLSGRLFAFYKNGEAEFFEMGEKSGKSTYKVKLKRQYKSGTEIYPVSIGRADACGRLLCPLIGFSEKHREVLISVSLSERSFYKKYEIAYGKGNALDI